MAKIIKLKTMKRITAIAKEVQRVGYRDEVERIARRLRLTGYVENLRPYDVRVVTDGMSGATITGVL